MEVKPFRGWLQTVWNRICNLVKYAVAACGHIQKLHERAGDPPRRVIRKRLLPLKNRSSRTLEAGNSVSGMMPPAARSTDVRHFERGRLASRGQRDQAFPCPIVLVQAMKIRSSVDPMPCVVEIDARSSMACPRDSQCVESGTTPKRCQFHVVGNAHLARTAAFVSANMAHRVSLTS